MQRTLHPPLLPDAAALEKLISAAVAAPSLHNSQPWRFRLDPGAGVLQVRAARDRALPREDPQGRGLHLSVGAALFNLRVAARHFGWDPEVLLLPRPSDPDLLAAVRLVRPGAAPSVPLELLHDAIWLRHTSRRPFSPRPVPPEVMLDLAQAARLEGASLTIATGEELGRVLALTAEAELRNRADPGRRAESRAWTAARQHRGTGIPDEALGPVDEAGRLPVRDFTGPRAPSQQNAALFEREPRIAVLATAHDRRADWLRSGEALERVLLTAAVNGLQSAPLHQALEWPDLRAALRDPARGRGHVQMLIRLGYGAAGHPSPRLSPDEVLEERPEDDPSAE